MASMLNIRPVSELPVSGKRVFVRVDFNCPQGKGGAITDDSRIRAALPTVEHVVVVPYGPGDVPDAITWDELLGEPECRDAVDDAEIDRLGAPPRFARHAFDGHAEHFRCGHRSQANGPKR